MAQGRGPETNMQLTCVYTVRKGKVIASSSSSGITPRPSKPWGCRSKTLTPTPEPAGYWACDVAKERRDQCGASTRPGRETSSLDRLELMDPEIEYVNPAGAVEPGTRRGRAAFSRAVLSAGQGRERCS